MEEAGARGNGADIINCILREKRKQKGEDFREPLAKELSAQHTFPLLLAETPLLLKASLSPLNVILVRLFI